MKHVKLSTIEKMVHGEIKVNAEAAVAILVEGKKVWHRTFLFLHNMIVS